MWRDFGGDERLASLLSRHALVVGTDALLRIRGGLYEVTWAVVGSYVAGTPGAIERIQRSSAHYMQRPDRTYAIIDPTRSSLAGWSALTTFNRTGGRHWLFGYSVKADAPTFETNDVALLNGADGVVPSFDVTYRETQPGRNFRSYFFRVSQTNEWNFGRDRQRGSVQTMANVVLRNYWTTSIATYAVGMGR
jgi:hypothetical protein